MRKVLLFLLTVIVLSACSEQEDNHITDGEEMESLSIEDVVVPEEIFISEKQNEKIEEKELKLSIKLYLDSFEELFNASEPFLEVIDEEEQLTADELEKISQIYTLMKSNDENFSNYIANNTLPEDYQEESERISQYIIAVNEIVYEIDGIVNAANEGRISKDGIQSIFSNIGAASGKEQKKIEDFLDRHDIKTKAFGRED